MARCGGWCVGCLDLFFLSCRLWSRHETTPAKYGSVLVKLGSVFFLLKMMGFPWRWAMVVEWAWNGRLDFRKSHRACSGSDAFQSNDNLRVERLGKNCVDPCRLS